MASQVESSSIGRQSKSEQRLEASLTKALEKIKQLESENESLRKQFTVAGDANLLEKMMKLRKQVRFLKQQMLVIRAQVLQLTIAIPQTVSWVQQSAHTAIESHAQQRRDLQNRLSRLKSVLKS